MFLYTDFNFKINKNQILHEISSYKDIFNIKKAQSLYNLLLPILYENIHPAGIFNIEKSTLFPIIEKYEYAIPCAITIGKSIDKKISYYFSLKKLEYGIILNSMANSYLFNISSQLFDKIYLKSLDLNIGLSKRLSPGDLEVPLGYGKIILEDLNISSTLNIEINENYMLNPIYSMVYIYGADKKITLNKRDHNCNECKIKGHCTMEKGLDLNEFR